MSEPSSTTRRRRHVAMAGVLIAMLLAIAHTAVATPPSAVKGGHIQELNCNPYILSGEWILRTDGDNAGQWSLSLTPSSCGRQITRTAEFAHMFDEVVTKFGDSRYFTNPRGMKDQLQCHLDNASGNNTWNLEPHRPDVGLTATKAAQCNPSKATLFTPAG
ncbi:hypothetical protein GCM10009552_03750 [Rothia nasimurium]|uniref:DUF2599 domain-containing protein n=1 Tax=Luteibacter anthropi TaxID=564369 RepID=A0A7X5ZJL8_9GAMM|nr:DUF2599 domain-containing protein [Luteibacter anthropi]NII07880.1 DUF2599 domain-containing protein [Luteibacter anthropi]